MFVENRILETNFVYMLVFPCAGGQILLSNSVFTLVHLVIIMMAMDFQLFRFLVREIQEHTLSAGGCSYSHRTVVTSLSASREGIFFWSLVSGYSMILFPFYFLLGF